MRQATFEETLTRLEIVADQLIEGRIPALLEVRRALLALSLPKGYQPGNQEALLVLYTLKSIVNDVFKNFMTDCSFEAPQGRLTAIAMPIGRAIRAARGSSDRTEFVRALAEAIDAYYATVKAINEGVLVVVDMNQMSEVPGGK